MFSIQRILIAAVLLLASGLVLHFALAGDGKPDDQGVKAEAPLALKGNCPVCLIKMGKVVKGSPEFLSVYDGRTYRFPGEKQLAMFKADPEKYIPALGGDCTVCRVEKGKKVAGNAEFFKIHDNRLFLFPGEKQRTMFEKNPGKYVNADLALDGNCPVCLEKMNKIVPGDPKFYLTQNGMRYLFPGEEQRKIFRENPGAFTGEVIEAKYRDLKQVPSEQETYSFSGKEDCGCEG